MVDWTVYDIARGAVIRTGSAAPDDALLQARGAARRSSLSASMPGRGTCRAARSPPGRCSPSTGGDPADGADRATLLLPGPFVALIDGVAHELEDVLEIASDMPATYRVEVGHFPYGSSRRYVAEIVAT